MATRTERSCNNRHRYLRWRTGLLCITACAIGVAMGLILADMESSEMPSEGSAAHTNRSVATLESTAPKVAPQAKGQPPADLWQEVDKLRRELVNERGLSVRLSTHLRFPFTGMTASGCQISDSAVNILELTDSEITSLEGFLTTRIQDVQDREIKAATLVSDAQGEYLHVPADNSAESDLDSVLKPRLKEMLGSSRGEIAFNLLKSDQNLYTSNDVGRNFYLTVEDEESESPIYYLEIRYVDGDGREVGGSKRLLDQSTAIGRYRSLFDSIGRVP